MYIRDLLLRTVHTMCLNVIIASQLQRKETQLTLFTSTCESVFQIKLKIK